MPELPETERVFEILTPGPVVPRAGNWTPAEETIAEEYPDAATPPTSVRVEISGDASQLRAALRQAQIQIEGLVRAAGERRELHRKEVVRRRYLGQRVAELEQHIRQLEHQHNGLTTDLRRRLDLAGFQHVDVGSLTHADMPLKLAQSRRELARERARTADLQTTLARAQGRETEAYGELADVWRFAERVDRHIERLAARRPFLRARDA